MGMLTVLLNPALEKEFSLISIMILNHSRENFHCRVLVNIALLEETKMNHYGKVMFRWMYWNFLLKGIELPIESQMSMAGKEDVKWKKLKHKSK